MRIVTGRRRSWSEWTVRLVALLFVVQGALLSFSQGASADTVRRDQFGNVLCLASAETGHGGTHRSPDGHADMMACCSLGCSMFAGLSALIPTPDRPVAVAVASAPVGFVSYADAIASVPKSPRTTRGPPAAI